MTTTKQQWLINAAVESAFERLADDLDSLASEFGLDSRAMREAVPAGDWDFGEYYDDWISEGWEPASASSD